jgi:diadenosine tetraphosphatase ApaH/serine/threonine PP2A family protein phosphatase
MKLALLSDIHSNIQAFDACIADACVRGATQFAFIGDYVGYGANPGEVVAKVMAMVDAGAMAVIGNHDAIACHPPSSPSDVLGEMTARWTHDQLSVAQRKFLRELPAMRVDGNVLLVHATAEAPERWHYLRDEHDAAQSLAGATAFSTDVRYVFGGHVHRQTLYYRGQGRGLLPFVPTAGVAISVPAYRRWIATIGSVGQPRDGRTDAMYALFDRGTAQLTFVRTPYDYAAAADAIRAAGLPNFFADRLLKGQ